MRAGNNGRIAIVRTIIGAAALVIAAMGLLFADLGMGGGQRGMVVLRWKSSFC